ncbi:hypothetical protein BC629DRAFT_400773 [Irpex lacteus]|nr:hypothetical protein BC629DRAFT_400773 [Irpex lacteus]
MSSPLCVAGSYREFPVQVLLDPTQTASCVSSSFALLHSIPATVTRHPSTSAATIMGSGPIVVPSVSGFFTSTLPVTVSYLSMYDVVLGGDWFAATGSSIVDGQVQDPTLPLALDSPCLSWSSRLVSHAHLPLAANCTQGTTGPRSFSLRPAFFPTSGDSPAPTLPAAPHILTGNAEGGGSSGQCFCASLRRTYCI